MPVRFTLPALLISGSGLSLPEDNEYDIQPCFRKCPKPTPPCCSHTLVREHATFGYYFRIWLPNGSSAFPRKRERVFSPVDDTLEMLRERVPRKKSQRGVKISHAKGASRWRQAVSYGSKKCLDLAWCKKLFSTSFGYNQHNLTKAERTKFTKTGSIPIGTTEFYSRSVSLIMVWQISGFHHTGVHSY